MGRRRKERAEVRRKEKMKRALFLLPLTIFPHFLLGCGQLGIGLPDHVIAQVNDELITVEEFNQEFKDVVLESEKHEKAALEDLKKAFLDQMIERKLLAQEARRSGIKISEEELTQAISEIKKDYPVNAFGERLGLRGMSLEDWKVRLGEKLLAEKMIRNHLNYQGEIKENEVRKYYETHLSLFQIPQRVRARQIIVADGEEAIQILKRLKKGESFEKLAKEKSLGPERIQGGDLGYFRQGERPSEFDPLFSMEVGAISDVIKSPYGYHIFKLEEKSDPRVITFEEARPTIIKELRKQKGEEEFQKWLKGLKGRAKLRVNKKWLRS